MESKRDETAASGSELFETVQEAIGGLSEHAGVERVFGDPIVAEGRTIIPIARISYAFGSGFGSGGAAGEDVEEETAGSGGGGGGAMSATPVGVLEVTDSESHFIPVEDRRRLVAALGAGILVGRLLWRR